MAEHQPRPPFIKHYSEIKQPDNSHYSGSDELHSIGSPFGRVFGLQRLGIHHELLPPGRRTSYPHAESMEEEFVYVIEGNPDAWINGHLHRLAPGAAFVSATISGGAAVAGKNLGNFRTIYTGSTGADQYTVRYTHQYGNKYTYNYTHIHAHCDLHTDHTGMRGDLRLR